MQLKTNKQKQKPNDNKKTQAVLNFHIVSFESDIKWQKLGGLKKHNN